MKFVNYLLLIGILISSCSKNDEEIINYDANYGQGVYILSDEGISYYNYQDSSASLKNNIFFTVNNLNLNNPKKIKFYSNKAYIIEANSISLVDVNTFEMLSSINGFINPVDINFVSGNRLFVADFDDSKVKVVDLDRMEITTDVETGDSTRPIFLISNSYKTFALNGGASTNQTKDSTLVAINHRDNLVSIADFSGNLFVGDNPNSAVISSDGLMYVLCKGIYNSIDFSENTQSSVSQINQHTNFVYETKNLPGIFNARNLIANRDNTGFYFIANGGVFRLNTGSMTTSPLININTSVITANIESVFINDSTIMTYEMLYLNDDNNPNNVYKYNVDLSLFIDTIVTNGNVLDINIR